MAIFMKKKRIKKEKGVRIESNSSPTVPAFYKKQDYSHYGVNKQYGNTTAYDKTLTKIDELDKILIDKFSGRRVIILEKLRGVSVRCMFSGKDYVIGSRYVSLRNDDECFGAPKVFRDYKDAIVGISKKIIVPYCLFGEMIGHDINSDIPYFYSPTEKAIVFHDIWLNDNWMNWDDFSDLAKEFNLPTVPVLGTLGFDEEKVKEYLNCFSLKSELTAQKLEGIIIRPSIEESHYSSRLIAKLTSEEYIKKFTSYSNSGYDNNWNNHADEHWVDGKWVKNTPLPSEEKKETLLTKAEEINITTEANAILDKFVNDARIIYWKNELDLEKIEIKDENIYKIFPVLVKNSVSDLLNEVNVVVTAKGINKASLLKELRRELPKRIVKILNLTLPEKIVLGD